MIFSVHKRYGTEILSKIGLQCTLVSSCALAKLSTAIAKNTFSRVSGHTVKGNPAYELVCKCIYSVHIQ